MSMNYPEISEQPYRECLIKMYETEEDVYTVKIFSKEQNLIHTMADIPHWEEADMWAMGFIDGYLLRASNEQ